MEIEITEPQSIQDFDQIFDLRWRLHRKPWNQPRGSEQDGMDMDSIHVIGKDDEEIIASVRGQLNTAQEAQVRFMSVDDKYQGKGIGTLILQELERKFVASGAKYVVVNARESAVPFYQKNGYRLIEPTFMLFGIVPHFKMRKDF